MIASFAFIRRFFSRLFFGNPLKATRQLLPELQKLLEDLRKIDLENNPIEGMVEYFKLLTPWADRGLNDLRNERLSAEDEYADVLRAIFKLESELKMNGYAWQNNRHIKGAVPTLKNVILGDMFVNDTAKNILQLPADDILRNRASYYAREFDRVGRKPLMLAIQTLILLATNENHKLETHNSPASHVRAIK